MTHVQKGAKYTLKNLLGKTREENDLRMKVLRYVMAVGFVLSPWLGGEAYAAGIERIDNVTFPDGLDKTYLQNGSNVAHIYAEQASGDVGLNRFKTFDVGAGQIANLYFKTSATDTNHLNTLVNTVQERISISGTVNAIRNNEVGGKLYFLSPKGMVVGSTGVINAGALTVITTGIDDITDPDKAMTAITAASTNNTYRALTDQPIEIHGQINTVNGIDLRSLSIAISKDSGSDIKPYLKTGVVFETIVNTSELNGLVGEVKLKSERSDSTDTKIELCAYKTYWDDYWEVTTPQFGNITLSECGLDAIGGIEIVGGQRVDVDNTTVIKSQDLIKFDLEHGDVGVLAIDNCRIETEGLIDMRVGNTITIGGDAYIISKITKNDTTSKVTLLTSIGDITNNGTISTKTSLDIQAGVKRGSDDASITNSGTIQATGGGMSFTVDKSLTNNGLIQADDQISFTVGGTLTNEGKIESTSSNVQAHIGRNFKNFAVYDDEYSENRILTGGIIKAGGNVQVDYNLDNEGIGVASSEERIDGIYNSGLIQANGNDKPESEGGVIDMNSGSGNIWLTSSYNITNYGNMIAGRQITLNARDFLHNYGLIQGVTYLDIKSIMGYVYNHNDGVIRATGGNIDLSSGQANLQIKNDTDGQKKELYRKFTPIIIEGIVQATSDDDRSNQTREGNIKITAYLGDIYVNGGTIETNAKTSETGEVKAVAGDVILDAAQNITIGFQTESALADDPTTDGANYNNDTEREYYKPFKDTSGNLVSGNAANISGTNIILTSGSGKTISMSAVNNTLTASNAITINTDSMDIVGGIFNAGTLAASKNLNITGGTINTNNITAGITDGVNNGGQLTITGGTINVANVTANGALTLTGGTVGRTDSSLSIIGTGDVSIGSDAIVRTSSDVSIASDEGTVTNNSELNISGSVSLSGKTDVTNSANITAGKDVSMTATTGKVNNSKVVKANGGNINLTGGTSINLQEGYGLEASDTINLTTDNMQITSGTIKANTLAASEALTLTGGTINAANISAGTNLIHNGATITADNDVTISAGNNINLQSGSLNAKGAAFVVTNGTAGTNSIVESTSGYNLSVSSLSLSANQGNIALKGTDNVLQSVTLAEVGGNVEIVNGNDTNKNVLTVSTAEGTTVGGTISIDNKGAGITVAGINATDAVNLTTGANITVAGDVAAANASFGAGVDFIHNGGAIAAGEVVVTAGQNVKLNGGSMVAAKSASLTANAGSIAEQAGYAIDAPQVTVSATGAINLDSTANQLVNVKVTKVGGDLTIGSGNKKNTDDLQVDVAQNVDGNLTLKNYSVAGDENANSIVVTGALSATKNITITNAEADINVGTGATVNAANISLEANNGTVNVTGNAVITAAKTGTLTANANNIIIAGGQITAGTATITSNGTADGSGFTMSGGTITAGTANITSAKAINQTAGSIVATNTVATAGGDLSLASSANKLQNVTVTANKGSVTIVSGNDAEGDLKVKTDGTIGGTLSITNVDDGVDNAIVIDNDLLANGNITITNQEADINLAAGSTLTSENGDVTIGSVNNVVSAGAINAGTLTASGFLNITGGAINVTNINANNALSIAGGTINAANVTATEALSVGDGSFTASKVTAKKTLSVTGGTINAANVAVTEAMSIAGGTIKNDTGKVSISAASIKMSGGTVEGSDVEIATTGNYEQTKGAVAGDVATINAKNMTISGGSITGKNVNISADEQVQLQSGIITVQNSNAGQLTIGAGTNFVHDGATITADNATINAVSGIDLTSGSLSAQEAALNVTNSSNENSIVEGADYSLVVNSLSVSANKGAIKLNGNGNILQSVTLANADGNVTIVNGNDTNHNALNVSTAGTDKVNGSINITNNGADITVAGVNARDAVNLTTGENITVTGAVSALGATLQASKGIDVTGSISATGDASLTAGANITVAGDVAAANASFGAGVDFIHDSGAIAAGEVVVTAGQNVQLDGGSMVAVKSVSLTAGAGENLAAGQGFIAEQAGYAIDAPQVTLSATGAINLDSTANQLVKVNVTKVGGDLTIGSGNKKSADNLQVGVAQNVDGDLTLKNYSVAGDENANSIVVAGALSATKNISITNAEANINVGTDATIDASNISLEANSGTVNVTGNAFITTANTGTFTANANNIIMAGGQITAGTATITPNGTADGSGFTMSGGTITAGTANITSAKAINQTAGSIVAENTVATAGSNLGLASSANKLQNVTVKAENGSVILVSGNDAGGDLNVHTNGTVGGTLSITNADDGVANAIVIDQNLLANESITITNQEADINLVAGSTLTSETGDVTIGFASNVVSAGTINAGTLTASGSLNITGGAIDVTNLNANNAMSVTGGAIAASEITATGVMSVGDGNVTASNVTAKKTLSVTGGTINAANVTVTEAMSIAGGTIKNDTGKVSVRAASIKMSGGTVEGSDVEIATTGNYEQTKGAVAGDVASINAKNMTISGGSITGKNVNISADEQVQLQKGSITVQNSGAGQLTVSAGNVLHNGATVKADKATINAVSGIDLTSGSLSAQEAALNVTNSTSENSIVEGASGHSLTVDSLSVSANHGNITLNGDGNTLKSVTLANAGGDITIVNGNDNNHNVLTVSTAGTNKVNGSINITNNGANITVAGVNARDAVNLTTGENITVTGAVNALGAILQAAKGIDVTGSINTTGDASLTAGANITVAGDVAATKASFGAGVDFIHNGGAIAAGEVVVTAGRDILLNSGSMEASTSASLAANAGSIAEQAGYAIDAPQVTASATGAINLDSTANQLVNVNATQVGGDLTIGSGNKKNTDDLQVDVAQNVDGNLTLKNYSVAGDENANSIVVTGELSATKNITITNAEANINVGTGATVNASNISLEANSGTVNVTGNAVITAAKTGTLTANANNIIIAGGQITAGTATITSNGTADGSGLTMNGGTITAGTANITSAKAINQTAGSIVAENTVATAGGDLSLASSANKLQNVTVTANKGSVTIVSGNDAGNALNVKTDGTVGGSLTITNVDDGVTNGANNAIVIDNDVLANGNITITNQEAGIELGSNVGITSQNGSINISAHDNFISAGRINAFKGIVLEAINKILDITGGSITATGGSITLHGKGGINNGASIAAKGNVSLYSTGGRITNSADITAGKNFASATRRAAFYSLRAVAEEAEETGSVIIEGNGGVTNSVGATISAQDSVLMSSAGDIINSSTVTASNGSVTMSGNGDVTNTGTIVAGSDVYMSSTAGNVQNSGTIAADQSVGMTADEGTVKNSNTVSAGTGTVTMSGKTGVVNDNASATISAGSGVSMTSSAEGVTNSSTVTSTSGAVVISGQTGVTNTGTVTTTSGSVEISGSEVANTGAVTASGGSVTMSGDGGVTNKANITAGTDVSMSSKTGDVETSGKIEAGNAVSMTSTEGNISSSSDVTANTGSVVISGSEVANTGAVTASGGSVTMSGDGGVTNKANITAGTDVSMNSTTGDVETSGKIEAGNAVSMTSTEGNISSSSEVTANTGSVEISGSSVANTGAVTASGGSVTMSGDGGVTNNATISAGTDVKMSSTTGDVATSGKIEAGSDVSMSSTTGDIKTSGTIEAGKDVGLSSTEGNVNNSGTIEANKNVNISADAGAITNIGSVTSEAGNIVLTSDQGITSKDGEASLITESLNGSISAATTYGEVNISEIIAGNTASVSSQNGSVIIGSVSGSDVVLTGGDSVSIGTVAGNDVVLTGGSDVTIDSVSGNDVAISGGSNSDVKADNITVSDSLKLQGDNITVSNVVPSGNTETNTLTVDVNGADGAGTAVKNDLVLNIDGDVIFDNLNVTDANITASGNIDVNKLRVEGEGQTTLESNTSSEKSTTVTVVGKDATPDAGSNVIVDPGNDSGNWLNIKMDEEGSKTTVVDDAGNVINDQKYPAQMSAKLVDYDPYDTYLDHYADMADIFSRSYLIEASGRYADDVLYPAQYGRVVLKQDANGLHLEIAEEQTEQEA